MYRHAARCRKHLSECAGLLASRTNLENLNSQDEYTQLHSDDSSSEQCSVSEDPVAAACLHSSSSNTDDRANISRYFNVMSDSRRKDLKEMLANAFFTRHISFAFTENKSQRIFR